MVNAYRLLLVVVSLFISVTFSGCLNGPTDPGVSNSTSPQVSTDASVESIDESGIESSAESPDSQDETSKSSNPKPYAILTSEDDDYYCPDAFGFGFVPCRVSLETGEVEYACPVSNCTHSNLGCFYYYNDVTSVYYKSGFMFFVSLDIRTMTKRLYAYDFSRYSMYEIPTKYPSMLGMILNYDNGCLYIFNSTSPNGLSLLELNLSTDVEKAASVKSSCNPYYVNDRILIAENEKGFFKFDIDSRESSPLLSEDFIGYKARKHGIYYKTDAPADIFDLDAGIHLSVPKKINITSPVHSGLFYYFQPRGKYTKITDLSGRETAYVPYENEIYQCGLDGSVSTVKINSDYHFVVYAAKGTKLIGRIMYRISEDGQIQLTDLGADHVYIDLEKGTASPLSLYGTNPI